MAAGIGLRRDAAAAGAGVADDAGDGLVGVDDRHHLRQLLAQSLNEMLWSATRLATMRPVSCSGKKLFGMIDDQPTLSATAPNRVRSTMKLWSSAMASVRS